MTEWFGRTQSVRSPQSACDANDPSRYIALFLVFLTEWCQKKTIYIKVKNGIKEVALQLCFSCLPCVFDHSSIFPLPATQSWMLYYWCACSYRATYVIHGQWVSQIHIKPDPLLTLDSPRSLCRALELGAWCSTSVLSAPTNWWVRVCGDWQLTGEKQLIIKKELYVEFFFCVCV